MKTKSQISVEFMFLIGFLTIISIAVIAVAGYQLENYNKRIETYRIKDLGESLKKEIETAAIVQDGYIRLLDVPETIEYNINYTLTSSATSIYIQGEHYSYSAIIPPIIGSIQKGTNTIKKINGEIIIEN